MTMTNVERTRWTTPSLLLFVAAMTLQSLQPCVGLVATDVVVVVRTVQPNERSEQTSVHQQHERRLQRQVQSTSFLPTPSFLLSRAASVAAEATTSSTSTSTTTNDEYAPIYKRSFTVKDRVVRVLDGNTVKLENTGLVSFASIVTPSGYSGEFPVCMTYTPASKAKQLLPPKTKVLVKLVGASSDTNSNNSKRALIVRADDNVLVNTELVRSGLAKPSPRGRAEADKILPNLSVLIQDLADGAKLNKVGMHQTCEAQAALQQEFSQDDQFEPLERTMETQYFADGGKLVVKEKPSDVVVVPKNPGDTKGCFDFAYFEDALRWYETYEPYYGDVAKLDSDKDGVPCPGLPHTPDSERYRLKVPKGKTTKQ